MPPKSNARKKDSLDADSDESNSNNSVSSNPKINKQPPRMRRTGDISTSTTNEPSSASATDVAVGAARHPGTLHVAAAAVPRSEKKPRRAGFREQFLQKLRVMLDRESQSDDATVQWSTDGNSFIIIDQAQFEEETIPTYFGNPIVFASFLRKLQRWGFNRVSSRRSGRYEFGSPTFKRMDARSATAPVAAAAATTNTAGNDSIQVPQQQQQQVMEQLNQPPMPAPNQLPIQPGASAIADLISNIQRSTQQPSTSSGQQPVLNQHSNQTNNAADVNSMLQNIVGRLLSGQNSVPSQQPPVPNHASSQLNNVAGNNYLQAFQQQPWQHPNPTMNLLNSVLNLVGGPTSSTQQVMGHSPPSPQSNAVHALMSLSGMLQQQPSLPNTNTTTTPASGMSSSAGAMMPQPNNMMSSPVISLLLVLQRFAEDEHQRRVQVDAIQNAIMTTIGRILGQVPTNNTAQPQQQPQQPRRNSLVGSNNNNTAQSSSSQQAAVGAGNNIQADSIAAILQAAQRGGDVAAAPPPQDTTRAQTNGPVDDNNNSDSEDDDNDDEDSEEEDDGPPRSTPRKRKASSPDEDQYDADDDSWNERLRPRKKSPPS